MNDPGSSASRHAVSQVSCPLPLEAFDTLAASWNPALLWRDRGSEALWLALGSAALFRNASELQQVLRQIQPAAGAFALRGFGCVAFDPESSLATPWEHFPARLFILPEVLIRWEGGRAEYRSAVALPVVRRELLERTLAQGIATPQAHVVDAGRVFDRQKWDSAIARIRSGIGERWLKKAVLARDTVRIFSHALSSAAVLRQLWAADADSYLFAYHVQGSTFLGASPEQLFRVSGRTKLQSESMAGTRRRGIDSREDFQLATELMHSAKDRAEQKLVTDYLMEAATALCTHVDEPAGPTIRALPALQHLHTEISGELAPGRTLDDVLDALHPTPAVCGLPRNRVRDLLSGLEPLPRGLYASAIGWMDGENAEFAVAIRSALLRGRRAVIYAGAGIMAESDAEMEWRETGLKMRPMLSALGC